MVNSSQCVDKCQVANEMVFSSFKLQIKYLKNKNRPTNRSKTKFYQLHHKIYKQKLKKGFEGRRCPGCACGALRDSVRLTATPLATQCDTPRDSVRLSATQCATQCDSVRDSPALSLTSTCDKQANSSKFAGSKHPQTQNLTCLTKNHKMSRNLLQKS